VAVIDAARFDYVTIRSLGWTPATTRAATAWREDHVFVEDALPSLARRFLDPAGR